MPRSPINLFIYFQLPLFRRVNLRIVSSLLDNGLEVSGIEQSDRGPRVIQLAGISRHAIYRAQPAVY